MLQLVDLAFQAAVSLRNRNAGNFCKSLLFGRQQFQLALHVFSLLFERRASFRMGPGDLRFECGRLVLQIGNPLRYPLLRSREPLRLRLLRLRRLGA
ncbi:MAG TPA: hypothetical protein VJT08_09335 [Terriglobales bacterium]|nr:hypothetical protein [Acidobacteriaceae bacterium]HKR30669.1 hypothetical protein [Terriglobales bacterium]